MAKDAAGFVKKQPNERKTLPGDRITFGGAQLRIPN
jgi:hypothetical protein